jgi:hypothetical protein
MSGRSRKTVGDFVKGQPSDEVHAMAYALSLFEAAKILAERIPVGRRPGVSLSFYLLIGLSIENALKAVLQFKKPVTKEEWKHSYDLILLRILAGGQGFVVKPETAISIDELSPLHRKHQFRYPDKAGYARLLNARPAAELTDGMLRDVYEFIGAKGLVRQSCLSNTSYRSSGRPS